MLSPIDPIKGHQAELSFRPQAHLNPSVLADFFRMLHGRAAGDSVPEPAREPLGAMIYDLNCGEPADRDPSRLGPPSDLEAKAASSGSEEASLEPCSNWIDPIAGLFLGGSNGSSPEAPGTAAGAGANLLSADMLRSIAWGGDRRRGTARLELGGSRFAGATLVVTADGAQLSVELEVPPGMDADELSARLTERFAEKGLVLRELRVR